MQNPNDDTEWNDVLRKKGIIPQKAEKTFTEDEIVNIVESAVEQKLTDSLGKKELEDLTLEELEALEDEEDERALRAYRDQRLAEIQQYASRAKYGDVREISGTDYVDEVTKAPEDVYVILHLYKQGIPYCTLVDQHLKKLAAKSPTVKFLKCVSTNCIANYPDANLPSVFVYKAGKMVKTFVGPNQFGGMKLTVDELEWMLSKTGAIKTDLEEDPRPRTRDVMMTSLGVDPSDRDDDW